MMYSILKTHAVFLGVLTFELLASTCSNAAVRVANVFGDNMVLQRERNLRVWGTAAAGEVVRVSFRGIFVKVTANAAGDWSVILPPQSAGGPFEMNVAGRTHIQLKNILVGDVWLASGQSNMEFSLKEADNGPSAVATAHDSEIRLLRVPRSARARTQSDIQPVQWVEATPTSVPDFSAVAYLFGRQLRKRYHVPIGLIEAAWGGTYAESWMSARALAPFPQFAAQLRTLEKFHPQDEADYRAYREARRRWDSAHRLEDDGRVAGSNRWADPEFDASQWQKILLPRPDAAWGTDFGGFDGIVWFRHDIAVAPEIAGRDLELHLGAPYHKLEAFFDGQPVQTISASAGVYRVSADRVTAGHHVIAQRLTGNSGFITLSGKPADLYGRAGDAIIALAGDWSFQPGTSLATF